MITPISTSFIIFPRCIFERGVSLGTITSLRDSLMHTPADLEIRLSSYPLAILDNVFILHGTIAMPSVLNEPLDIAAAMLSLSWHFVASDLTYSIVLSVSILMFLSPHLLITR